MTQITLTPDQFESLSQAKGRVRFIDSRGCVFVDAELIEPDPHQVQATTISELLDELSEDELSEDELKSRLENFTPVAWYRP